MKKIKFRKIVAIILCISMILSMNIWAYAEEDVGDTNDAVTDETSGGDETTGGDDTTGGDETTGNDDTTGGDGTTGGDDTTGGDETTGGDDTAGGDETIDGDGTVGGDDTTGGDDTAGNDETTGGDDTTGGDGTAGGDEVTGNDDTTGGDETEDDATEGDASVGGEITGDAPDAGVTEEDKKEETTEPEVCGTCGNAECTCTPVVEKPVEIPATQLTPAVPMLGGQQLTVNLYSIDADIIVASGKIQELEREPGETVTLAFIDETPDFVLWKLGAKPWADLDDESEDWGVIEALEDTCEFTVPEDAEAGTAYMIGVLWPDESITLETLDPSMVESVAVITIPEQEMPNVSQSVTIGDEEYNISLDDASLPEGVTLVAEEGEAAPDSLTDSALMTTVKTMAFDISPTDAEGKKWQPADGDKVTVTIDNIYDPKYGEEAVVYVYHILDDVDAIRAGYEAGTVLLSDDTEMIETYADEAELAQTALGLDAPVVAYEVFSTHSGTVELDGDGGITFAMSSFSDVNVQSGGSAYWYIARGANDTLTINNKSISITKKSGYDYAGITIYGNTVSVANNALIGHYPLTVSWGRDNNATVNLIVLDSANSHPVWIYTLLPGMSIDDTSTPNEKWNGMGIGSISGVYAPTSYSIGHRFLEGNDTILSTDDDIDITLPASFPDIKVGDLTYKYAAPGSGNENTAGYYTIDWMQLVVSNGANSGNNNYNPTAPAGNGTTNDYNTFHLDGQLILTVTNKYTVMFKIQNPGSQDFVAVQGYTFVLDKNTEESQISRPTPESHEGYTFDGWYTDEDCTQKADFSGTITGNKTYYGKYVSNIPQTVDLTITKTVSGVIDQDFIFTVTGSKGFAAQVVIPAKNFSNSTASVTITGLPANDTYTVTENTAWSWRYALTKSTVAGSLTFAFTNTRADGNDEKNKWFDSTAIVENKFAVKSAGSN